MSMFSKRHYIYLARVLRHAAAQALVLDQSAEKRAGIQYTTLYLTDQLAMDNPAFNRDKFLTACGLEDEV